MGVLTVNSSFEYNIDYEKYEVVYLSIVVEDINQTIMPNSDLALLVVRIIDENDNPPQFVGDTLTVARHVIEEAVEDTLIGNIIASDIDGPGNNIISYTIIPKVDTPADWLQMDVDTGVIRVRANREIGCDVPKRDFLSYDVRLYDGANETFGQVKNTKIWRHRL